MLKSFKDFKNLNLSYFCFSSWEEHEYKIISQKSYSNRNLFSIWKLSNPCVTQQVFPVTQYYKLFYPKSEKYWLVNAAFFLILTFTDSVSNRNSDSKIKITDFTSYWSNFSNICLTLHLQILIQDQFILVLSRPDLKIYVKIDRLFIVNEKNNIVC